MAGKIPCPKCKQLYPFKTELIGRQVKCKKCGQIFRVGDPNKAVSAKPAAGPSARPAVKPASEPSSGGLDAGAAGGSLDSLFGEEFDDQSTAGTRGVTLGPALPSQAAAASRPAAPARPQPGAGTLAGGGAQTPVPSGAGYAEPTTLGGGYSSRRRAEEMTDQDKNIMQAGIYIAAIGMLALILPIFGLQFRHLAAVGEALPYVALGMGIVGSAVAAFGARKNLGLAGGTGGGMLAVLLVVYLISSHFGVSKHEAAIRDMLSYMRKMTNVMSTIEDAKTAEAAADDLKDIVEDLAELAKEIQKMEAPSPAEDRRLQEKYEDELKDAIGDFMKEAIRVGQIAEARPALEKLGRELQGLQGPVFAGRGSPFGGFGSSAPSRPPSYGASRPLSLGPSRPGSSGPSQPRKDPKQDMIDKHGASYVVEVKLNGLPDYIRPYTTDRLRKMSGAQECRLQGSGGKYTFLLGPVADVQALADAIDFGDVTRVDTSGKIIEVRVDQSKLPPPLGPEIKDPSHPKFYQQNLADLKSYDEHRRNEAVKRLKAAEPKELRKEIAEALRRCINESESFAKRDAIEAFGVWGGADAVPDLIEMLRTEQEHWDREAVIQALAETKDPRAVEPLAAMLADDRADVVEPLKKLGPVAEDAVLRYLNPNDDDACDNACEVLKVIGTEKSLPALKAIARSGVAERNAEEAVLAIAKPQDEMEQILLDLELGKNRARGAAERLSRMEPVDAHREQVANALAAWVPYDKQAGFTRSAVAKALGVWHTPETLPELVKLAKDQDFGVRWAAIEGLGNINTEEAARALVDLWLTGEDSMSAEGALKKMGPVAEDPVAELLKNPDKQVRVRACRILEQVGTRKSLQTLARLARDPDRSLGFAAQRAAQAINQRN